jgi:hypothetical protein
VAGIGTVGAPDDACEDVAEFTAQIRAGGMGAAMAAEEPGPGGMPGKPR